MNKRKSIVIVVILLLVSSLIFQLSYESKLSKENYLIKNQQGEIIERNLSYVWNVVSSARKDLADDKNPDLNGTDNMKFYSLNSDGNETMEKALKILTQENGAYGNK